MLFTIPYLVPDEGKKDQLVSIRVLHHKPINKNSLRSYVKHLREETIHSLANLDSHNGTIRIDLLQEGKSDASVRNNLRGVGSDNNPLTVKNCRLPHFFIHYYEDHSFMIEPYTTWRNVPDAVKKLLSVWFIEPISVILTPYKIQELYDEAKLTFLNTLSINVQDIIKELHAYYQEVEIIKKSI